MKNDTLFTISLLMTEEIAKKHLFLKLPILLLQKMVKTTNI